MIQLEFMQEPIREQIRLRLRLFFDKECFEYYNTQMTKGMKGSKNDNNGDWLRTMGIFPRLVS